MHFLYLTKIVKLILTSNDMTRKLYKNLTKLLSLKNLSYFRCLNSVATISQNHQTFLQKHSGSEIYQNMLR